MSLSVQIEVSVTNTLLTIMSFLAYLQDTKGKLQCVIAIELLTTYISIEIKKHDIYSKYTLEIHTNIGITFLVSY